MKNPDDILQVWSAITIGLFGAEVFETITSSGTSTSSLPVISVGAGVASVRGAIHRPLAGTSAGYIWLCRGDVSVWWWGDNR